MYLFCQEGIVICFIAIQTRFLGKNVLEEVLEGKVLSNRVKISQFFLFLWQIAWN